MRALSIQGMVTAVERGREAYAGRRRRTPAAAATPQGGRRRPATHDYVRNAKRSHAEEGVDLHRATSSLKTSCSLYE